MPKGYGRMHMEIIDLTDEDTAAERPIGWVRGISQPPGWPGHKQRPAPPQKREAEKPRRDEKDQKTCIICYDHIQSGQETFTPCMHGPFHLQCIERWKAMKPKCPLCNGHIGDGPEPHKRRSIVSLEDAFIPMD